MKPYEMTLAELRNKNPCSEGWVRLLRGLGEYGQIEEKYDRA